MRSHLDKMYSCWNCISLWLNNVQLSSNVAHMIILLMISWPHPPLMRPPTSVWTAIHGEIPFIPVEMYAERCRWCVRNLRNSSRDCCMYTLSLWLLTLTTARVEAPCYLLPVCYLMAKPAADTLWYCSDRLPQYFKKKHHETNSLKSTTNKRLYYTIVLGYNHFGKWKK